MPYINPQPIPVELIACPLCKGVGTVKSPDSYFGRIWLIGFVRYKRKTCLHCDGTGRIPAMLAVEYPEATAAPRDHYAEAFNRKPKRLDAASTIENYNAAMDIVADQPKPIEIQPCPACGSRSVEVHWMKPDGTAHLKCLKCLKCGTDYHNGSWSEADATSDVKERPYQKIFVRRETIDGYQYCPGCRWHRGEIGTDRVDDLGGVFPVDCKYCGMKFYVNDYKSPGGPAFTVADQLADRLLSRGILIPGNEVRELARQIEFGYPRPIPVSEGIPDGLEAFGYMKDEGWTRGSFHAANWLDRDDRVYRATEITHYMPLPPDPE